MKNDDLDKTQFVDAMMKHLDYPIQEYLADIGYSDKSKVDEYLTVEEAKSYMNLSRQTLDKYVREGTLKKTKMGRNTRYRKSELDKLFIT